MDPNDRDYSNDEITVHWKPPLCIHATTCYRELIAVFNPRNRPWVNMEGAPTGRIIEIVKKCPTKALTYDWKDPARKSDKPQEDDSQAGDPEIPSNQKSKSATIRIMRDGPYVVEGDFRIIDADGKELKLMRMTSFCRCGASESMPFCDGSHRMDNFMDDFE